MNAIHAIFYDLIGSTN